MKDYLLRHVVDNVWCNPRMDRQYSYLLRRLTPVEGVRSTYVIGRERYPLPTVVKGDIWHVFQIGQVLPVLINFPNTLNTWIPLAQLTQERLLDCEVYDASGIIFPRSETFVLVTESKNLLVAVRNNDRYPKLDNPSYGLELYIHLYSNAFFNSDRATGFKWINVYSKVASSIEDVRQFQIKIMDLEAATGIPGKWYVNGRLVNQISAAVADMDDYLEFVHDGSVKDIKYFDIRDLDTFVSSLDNTPKYILHYPGKTDMIDYLDDLDIYLVRRAAVDPSRYTGVLYNRNKGDWVRQLTHKDYSLRVDSIDALFAVHPEDTRYIADGGRWPSDKWNAVDELTLKVYIRHGGHERGLVNDVSRTKYLYQLPEDTIRKVLVGKDSVAECWLAENLERSRYVGFMGLPDYKVYPKGFGLDDKAYPDKEFITTYAADALGYHSAAKLLSDSPLKVQLDVDSVKYVDLTYNHWENSTMFEYSEEGLLLGHYFHLSGSVYYPTNDDCYLVEPIIGKGSMRTSGYYDKRIVDIPKGHTFRVYISTRLELAAGRVWTDITDTADVGAYGYLDVSDHNNHKWVWLHDPVEYDSYIRTDESFYLKEMSLTRRSGVLRFAIDAFEYIRNEWVNRLLEIPFGQLDIFLNGYSLTEDVDFISGDLRTVISNLSYLEEDVNKVVIRGTGFCSPDMKRYKPTDTGFIEYGVLSSNGRHELRSGKVQRIVADGRVLHPDDVVYDEDDTLTVMTQVRNGAPYQIQTPQTTFREVYPDDYNARIRDDIIDKQVSDYLTYYLPIPEREFVDSIEFKCKVVSAGSNLILHLIMTGRLKPIVVNDKLDELAVINSVKEYDWIKRLDIANTDYNSNHIYVYPHWFDEPVGLDWFEYKMYNYIMKQFLNKPLDTSKFIYLTRTQ